MLTVLFKMTPLEDLMNAKKSRDVLREALVDSLKKFKDSLPDEIRALLIADETATYDFTRAFEVYREH